VRKIFEFSVNFRAFSDVSNSFQLIIKTRKFTGANLSLSNREIILF